MRHQTPVKVSSYQVSMWKRICIIFRTGILHAPTIQLRRYQVCQVWLYTIVLFIDYEYLYIKGAGAKSSNSTMLLAFRDELATGKAASRSSRACSQKVLRTGKMFSPPQHGTRSVDCLSKQYGTLLYSKYRRVIPQNYSVDPETIYQIRCIQKWSTFEGSDLEEGTLAPMFWTGWRDCAAECMYPPSVDKIPAGKSIMWPIADDI